MTIILCPNYNIKNSNNSLSHESKALAGTLAKSSGYNAGLQIESKKIQPPKKIDLPLLSKEKMEVQYFQPAFNSTKPKDDDIIDDEDDDREEEYEEEYDDD